MAVVKQYLDLIDMTNILPNAIRSDRGTEATMMANAHWQLNKTNDDNIQVNQIYWYGISTLNQKIVSCWRGMSKSQTSTWKGSNLSSHSDPHNLTKAV